MADDADRANEIVELSLANILNNSPKFDKPSLSECLECDEDIPEKRRAMGGVSRCVDCQGEFEKRSSHAN